MRSPKCLLKQSGILDQFVCAVEQAATLVQDQLKLLEFGLCSGESITFIHPVKLNASKPRASCSTGFSVSVDLDRVGTQRYRHPANPVSNPSLFPHLPEDTSGIVGLDQKTAVARY